MQTLDSLIASLRDCCGALPDKRQGANGRYSMSDFGLSAFSLFFMQSPSFLAYQRQLAEGCGRSNCESLFGIDKIPCDNQIRAMLDPVDPAHFQPLFADTLERLKQIDGLQAFRRLDGHVLIAFDGTEYFRSKKLSCGNCSTRRRGEETEYFHTLLAATLVAPGHGRVLPLEPAFVAPQDGHDKQDCESRAVRRWLEAHGERYAEFDPIYLGDDLYSCQPVCKAVLAARGHFLFVCKPSSHPTLAEYLSGIALPEHSERVKRGRRRYLYRYRWLSEVPLRDGDDALAVNWLSIEIFDPAGKLTYTNSFVTDLPVSRDNVAELASCGRARWKIENESFNTLKTKGYHLEHNFGHGKQNLAAVLATLNLLAFAFHTVCEITDGLWSQARQTLGPRTRFFETLRSLTAYLLFPSWQELLQTMAFQRAPPRPP